MHDVQENVRGVRQFWLWQQETVSEPYGVHGHIRCYSSHILQIDRSEDQAHKKNLGTPLQLFSSFRKAWRADWE